MDKKVGFALENMIKYWVQKGGFSGWKTKKFLCGNATNRKFSNANGASKTLMEFGG